MALSSRPSRQSSDRKWWYEKWCERIIYMWTCLLPDGADMNDQNGQKQSRLLLSTCYSRTFSAVACRRGDLNERTEENSNVFVLKEHWTWEAGVEWRKMFRNNSDGLGLEIFYVVSSVRYILWEELITFSYTMRLLAGLITECEHCFHSAVARNWAGVLFIVFCRKLRYATSIAWHW